jgi:signal transduction histidine kinase
MDIARPQSAFQVTPIRVAPSRVAGAVLILLSAMALLTALYPSSGEILGPLGVLAGNGTAGVLMLRKRRALEGRERTAWGFVAAGFMVAGLGVLVVGAVGAVTGAAPAFGPLDLFFIAAYALVIGGLAALPHVSGNAMQRVRVWLDGLIGSVALATLLWVLVLHDLMTEMAGGPRWDRIIGSAYPVLDVVALVVVMIVVVRRSNLRFDLRLMFLAVGLIAQAVGDLTLLTSGVGKTLAQAEPSYTVYLVAAISYLLAAIMLNRRPQPREYAVRPVALWAVVAPYSAAAVLVGVLVGHLRSGGVSGDTLGLTYATLAIAALVVGRQAVAIRENRMLVERQRATLVSSISHELRTPLTAMVGFLSLLEDSDEGLPEDERQEVTGIVHQQAVYMSRIVSDLIMLARGNPDEIELDVEDVAMWPCLMDASRAVEDATSDIAIECPEDLHALVDRDRLQQVLVNLMMNAERYGGGSTLVRVSTVGDDVVIEVHDDGPGVPTRYEIAIWERFERGANRYNAASPGSGIGLAVVKAVAKAHGGSAEYERSKLLGGACFRVTFAGRRLPTRARNAASRVAAVASRRG